MDLTNEFDVAASIDQTWRVLTDLERIAPCLPGAQLQEVEGDEYRGVVKVKVGPITAQYKGKASFTELDVEQHRAVLAADGRDTRGQGNASATITATLTPTTDGTHVEVVTDLTITGKVAQFGRGVMADVSAKLLAQFAENLATSVLADDDSPAEAAPDADAPPVAEAPADAADASGDAVASEPPTPEAVAAAPAEAGPMVPSADPAPAAVRKIDGPEAAPLDLMEVAGGRTMLKLALPVVTVLVVIVVVVVLLAR